MLHVVVICSHIMDSAVLFSIHTSYYHIIQQVPNLHQDNLLVTAILALLPDCYFRVIDTAARQLTRTAITVTIIFIISLGPIWYYVLGYSGITEYTINTPIQKIGNFSVSFFPSISNVALKENNFNFRTFI